MRVVAALVGGMVATFACAAFAQSPNLLVSGQSTLAIIDNNGDGPGPGDCMFTGGIAGSAFFINGSQTNTPLLRVCDDSMFTGMVAKGFDTSSNFGSINFTGSSIGGGLPVMLELVDETMHPSADAPLHIDSPDDLVTLSGAASGTGSLLCLADNAPAARVDIPGAGTMLMALSFFPSDSNPQFLCIPGLPLQDTGGMFDVYSAYIPLTGKHITISTVGDPPFVDIDLTELPQCVRSAAPAASTWGLMGLLLLLLIAGTWQLGRQQAFSDSLARL